MRLFIAIELPETVKQLVTSLKHGTTGVRWVPPEILHLTLLFLGDISEGLLEPLQKELCRITMTPISLTLHSTGCFPHQRAPRVLWLGLERQPLLNQLTDQIKSAVDSCGLPIEDRPFRPHITVGRIKQGEPCNCGAFLRQKVEASTFDVREFILFKSTLTQQGAVHKPLQIYGLNMLR